MFDTATEYMVPQRPKYMHARQRPIAGRSMFVK